MKRYTLLLLPGFDGTGLLFKPLLRVLPERFVPIVVSYPPTTPMSYMESAEFAVQFIPDNMPCVVLGESYSGPVALHIAAYCPSRVAAVVLCSTFTNSPAPSWLLHLGRVLPLSLIASSFPKWLLRLYLLEPTTALELLNVLQQSLQIPNSTTLRQRLRNIANVQANQELRRCTTPILALVGAKDKLLVSHWHTQTVHQPSLHIASIAAPHLLLQTHPQEAVAAIEQFLQECSEDV